MKPARAAKISDLSEITRLLREAADWLSSRGIDQWTIGYPEERIASAIADRRFFVVDDPDVADRLSATMELSTSNTDTWAERGDDGKALYVHRLAVDRAHAGKGRGRAMLDFAGSIAHALGRRYLRLDCAADNPGLRAVYENAGFDHVTDREIPAPDGSRVFAISLYERNVPATNARNRP